MKIVSTNEVRCTAIMLSTNLGPLLLVNVHMPTDYGNLDCSEEYLDVCSKIFVMCQDSDAAILVVMGDFNCSPQNRSYNIFSEIVNR